MSLLLSSTSACAQTCRDRFPLSLFLSYLLIFLLSKRRKTLTRNCFSHRWKTRRKKKSRTREKNIYKIGMFSSHTHKKKHGHVQEAERVCSGCVCTATASAQSFRIGWGKRKMETDTSDFIDICIDTKIPTLVTLWFLFLPALAWYRYAYQR